MSLTDFLKEVLPGGTRYGLKFINKQQAIARIYDELSTKAENDIQDAINNKLNVYYVTAGLGAGKTCEAVNATAKRELYIDVDCGPTKPYPTKDSGLIALVEFAKKLGLPRATLIDSGNGVHAHWFFMDPIPVHDWKEMATALKARCIEYEFKVDGGCTGDIVRVLRVPGTLNFKAVPIEVKLLTPVKYYDAEKLRKIIGAPPVNLLAQAKALTSAARAAGIELETFKEHNHLTSKFEQILNDSIDGIGCEQIRTSWNSRTALPEPLWRANLSIAKYCEDHDWAIHHISQDYPKYSPQETEYKAAGTKGPYTCESFRSVSDPAICGGCVHKGKITSPIQLGHTIKKAADDDNTIKEGEKTYEITPYPKPYLRGEGGGIYKEGEVTTNKAGEKRREKDIEVYPHDLYVFDVTDEPELGHAVWFRHHLPHNPVREFSVSMKDAIAPDKLMTAIAHFGAFVNTTKSRYFQDYVSRQVKEIQRTRKVQVMHGRFGWTEEGTFIVGELEYTRDGVRKTQVSRSIERFVKSLTPRGSMKVWQDIAHMFDAPEYDLHALGILAGFGSVLMRFSGEQGAVINYYSHDSGSGKTTVLKVANSIFGDPIGLMKDARDTQLSRVRRMATMNGIVVCMDEMTNAAPEVMSNDLYGATQGRERDRMHGNVNAERHNEATWALISLWSSNASVATKLASIKLDPQGELARVVEIALPTITNGNLFESQETFNALNENYGWAAQEYLRYVIPHEEQIRAMFIAVKKALYDEHTWTQADRYKINLLTCIITAGMITNKLGILRYNIQRIKEAGLKLIVKSAKRAAANRVTALGIFGMFINKNINNMLLVDDKPRVLGLPNAVGPHDIPRGELMMRYEPDTKLLFITKSSFTEWCAKVQLNVDEIPAMFLKETGAHLRTTKKRMTAGWKGNSEFPAQTVYVIDNSKDILKVNPSDDVGTEAEDDA